MCLFPKDDRCASYINHKAVEDFINSNKLQKIVIEDFTSKFLYRDEEGSCTGNRAMFTIQVECI